MTYVRLTSMMMILLGSSLTVFVRPCTRGAGRRDCGVIVFIRSAPTASASSRASPRHLRRAQIEWSRTCPMSTSPGPLSAAPPLARHAGPLQSLLSGCAGRQDAKGTTAAPPARERERRQRTSLSGQASWAPPENSRLRGSVHTHTQTH